MKKEKREIYQVLEQEIDACLCTFCKYSKFQGSPCYGDASIECHHPLEERYEFFMSDEDVAMGRDCWGYSPDLPLEDVADIVGIILAEGFKIWVIDHSDKSQIKVVGTTKE